MKRTSNEKCDLFLRKNHQALIVHDNKIFSLDSKWGQMFQHIRNDPKLIDKLEQQLPLEIRKRLDQMDMFGSVNKQGDENPVNIPLTYGDNSLSNLFKILLENSNVFSKTSQHLGGIYLEEGFDYSAIKLFLTESYKQSKPCLIAWIYQDRGFIKYFDPSFRNPCPTCLLGRFISNVHLPKLSNDLKLPPLSFEQYYYLPFKQLTPMQKFSFVVQGIKMWVEKDTNLVCVLSFQSDSLEKVGVLPLPDCKVCNFDHNS